MRQHPSSAAEGSREPGRCRGHFYKKTGDTRDCSWQEGCSDGEGELGLRERAPMQGQRPGAGERDQAPACS